MDRGRRIRLISMSLLFWIVVMSPFSFARSQKPGDLKKTRVSPTVRSDMPATLSMCPFEVRVYETLMVYMQKVKFRAKLFRRNGAQGSAVSIVDKPISFSVEGKLVGMKSTNQDGSADVEYTDDESAGRLAIDAGIHEIVAKTSHEGMSCVGRGKLIVWAAGVKFTQSVDPPLPLSGNNWRTGVTVYALGQRVTLHATAVHYLHPNVPVQSAKVRLVGSPQTQPPIILTTDYKGYVSYSYTLTQENTPADTHADGYRHQYAQFCIKTGDNKNWGPSQANRDFCAEQGTTIQVCPPGKKFYMVDNMVNYGCR